MISATQQQAIVQQLQQTWPNALAIYAFGSQVSGDATTASDLDLAILVEGYCDTLTLWNTAQNIACKLNIDVDLLDFRATSTVMQHQILTTGLRWWHKDSQADLYEAAVLNDKLTLDEARQPLLNDINKRGNIYG